MGMVCYEKRLTPHGQSDWSRVNDVTRLNFASDAFRHYFVGIELVRCRCRHVGTETGISQSTRDLKIDRVSYKTRAKVTRVDVSMESSLACRDAYMSEIYIVVGRRDF